MKRTKTFSILHNRHLAWIMGLFLLTLPFVFQEGAFAQDNKGIGLHGAPFLRINPTARAVAMGEAYSAIGGEITALRFNPANLGLITKTQLLASFHNWIDDTQQGALGVALSTKFGVIAVDFTYFNEGEIQELDESFFQTGGSSSSDDILFTVAYANKLKMGSSYISFGGAAKFLRQNLIGEQSTAYGADIGVHYFYKYFALAASAQNIGFTKIKFANQSATLPMAYRGGAGLFLPLSNSFDVNLTADVLLPKDENLRYYAGGEFIISELIALRAGFKFHEVEVNRWSAGVGLNMPADWLAYSRLRFDYAYAPMDAFDEASHRFSLVLKFGVAQRVYSMGMMDRSGIDDRLQQELEAAEKARKAAQEAEERTRAMEERARKLEEEIANRLARIQKIAAESQGKIEVEPKTREKILVSMRINFDFDKANIRSEEFETMHKVGEILNTYPEAKVQLSGHTDYIGTEEYNIRLSQRRIDSVMVFLINKEKISREKFYMPVGYGESRPIATNETAEGRFRNRRVEFLLYTMDSVPEMPEASAIKAIEILDDQTVRIICNGKVAFKQDMLDNPNRLVIDFANIFLLNDIASYELNRGAFLRARLGYHPSGKFSRVVFDLSRKIDADIKSVDNFVVISVK